MPPPQQAVFINTVGKVLNHPAKVRRGLGENLVWVAKGNGGPWTITFGKVSSDPSTYPVKKGSPFSKSTYEVPKGGSVATTGGAVSGAVGNTYRYTVKDVNGDLTHDPDVDIES